MRGAHWTECWRTHHECAVAEVERLKNHNAASRDKRMELGRMLSEVRRELDATRKSEASAETVSKVVYDDMFTRYELLLKKVDDLQSEAAAMKANWVKAIRMGRSRYEDVCREKALVDDLQKRLDEAEGRLGMYGDHLPKCSYWRALPTEPMECDCGWVLRKEGA